MLLCMKRSRAAIEPRQAQLDNQQRAEQNRHPGASKEDHPHVLVCSGGPVELRVQFQRAAATGEGNRVVIVGGASER